MNRKKRVLSIILSGMILTGCSNTGDENEEISFEGELNHVHGMGYAGNDGGVYFASHTGPKIYREGEWFAISDNFFDYMGFNAVEEGFYTSGHPSADSDMLNPLEIQKSKDGRKTLEHIAFEGETDFHAMAVGYTSQDIFLLNPEENSLLKPGFYKSNDKGETWEAVNVNGLEGEVSGLALHPQDSSLVAAATSTGIYVSEDGGKNFGRVTDETDQGTAVFYSEDSLFYANYGTSASLIKYTIETKKEEIVTLPELPQDGVAFIFQNPNDSEEIALYTLQGEAFLTKDNAKTWLPLLNEGNVQ